MKYVALSVLAVGLVGCGGGDVAEVEAAEVVFPTANLWVVDPAQSRIAFTGSQEGTEFTGTFADYDLQISLDPDAPESGQILAQIRTESAESGDEERDRSLPTKDWFHVSRFPVATFSSDSIERVGMDYLARGELSLKGVSLPVELPFTLRVDESGRARAAGKVTLDRQAYGVGAGAYDTDQWIAFPVTVEVEIAARRAE